MRFAPGARRLALPPGLAAVALLPVAPVGSAVAAVAGLAVLWFHRDPDRSPPDGAGYLAPADGTVTVLREEDGRVRVGVFMNVTDVHVNRAPVAGEVEGVEHVPGANRPAFSKESDRNERVHVDLGEARVTLIAGWFARRIHPAVEPGDRVARGERIGHVSFGSRADVLFPPGVAMADVAVEKGETVRAGETILASP
ncbi:MAG: protein sorting system archaetidylserine decarboxylase [Halanaeroarchaeum sp.]